MIRAALALAALALHGCGDEAVPMCSGPEVASPDGVCRAHYFQADYDGSVTTQALFSCRLPQGEGGGNLAVYSSSDLRAGMGLEWLGNDRIRVLLPIGAPRPDNPDPIQFPDNVQFFDRVIAVEHGVLPQGDPAGAGCGLPVK